MSMHHYYDYYPSHHISRPLAIVSFVDYMTRAVANHVASTTGLPLRLIGDLVEHRVGASASEFIAEHGLARWRDAEAEELDVALRSRPPSILALGDGTLLREASLDQVLMEADLVYLYLSYEEAREQARQQPGNLRATLFAELEERAVEQDSAIFGAFTERRAAYERAQVTIDAYRRRVPALGRLVIGGMVPVS